MIYDATLLRATTPPRRTDTHRLPAAVARARDVPGRVDGSEVEGADSSLGANIVTAGHVVRVERWEDGT